MLYTVQGIVLRTTDYGEGNKILRLLTREAGKVGVMARGAKKVKSRFGAATQPFTCGEYVYFKSSGLGTLSSAEITYAHNGLHEDLMKSAYASYVAEMADRMLEDGEGSAALYDQLAAALAAIEDDKDAQIVVHIFEMQMLKMAGYAPILEECVSCGSRTGPFAFSAQLGGTLCPLCLHKDAQGIALPEGALKLLRLFTGVDIRRLGATTVKSETKAVLKQCMRAYMDAHIGIAWKARHFLDQMEKYPLS
ncbi:DNA recombination protein RecO [Gordoniibacillus kamchatkensis]|uniref:DNA repair protein RecO n=1 Tax=Gordoniibacillus kamchatkensis TaxID=1590651 RepID=A0ABR5AKY9_9BACL|nr:DNA repair protein RecO [Paenibacillus sp. VKM B-2647]KIL41711.1 DNA recombination protein RecO [Paenibacillus sp. VKM B-2647]